MFLFWGLFRSCTQTASGWRYSGPRQHAIFGWLQVETVVDLSQENWLTLDAYPWLAQHPHARHGWGTANAIYIARKNLTFGGGDLPGYGVFTEPLMLTSLDAKNPSLWHVPSWLDPLASGVGMTYHPHARWLGDGRLNAAARGQEFVADIGTRSDALDWLISLFGNKKWTSGPTS